ncbi:MAG: hypothetical protein ACYS22_16615 [Planctomycetota bacterium]|jgi:hypothetical protein
MRKRSFLLAAFGLVLGLLASSPAKAQFYQVAKVESQGGFVSHSDTATFWAYVSAGQIRAGYVHIDRNVRRGGPGRFTMTGQMTPRETYELWLGIYQAQPWKHAEVAANSVNTDFPNTIVTYLGRYTQKINAGFISPAAVPASMPRVTPAMEAFTRKAWGIAGRVSAEPRFQMTAMGGRLGYNRTLTITNSGTITDEVSYRNPNAPAQPYSKTGQLTLAEINSFTGLAAGWSSFPDRFSQGNPSHVDGIDVFTTYYRWGFKDEVFAGWARDRTPDYQAILDYVNGLAGQL